MLHCTEPFIITIQSTQYDLNTFVLKTQHIMNIKTFSFIIFVNKLIWKVMKIDKLLGVTYIINSDNFDYLRMKSGYTSVPLLRYSVPLIRRRL